MRRYVAALLSIVAGLNILASAAPALALDPFAKIPCGAAAQSALCTDKSKTGNPLTGSNGLLHKATQIVAVVTGSVAVIIIIVGGFMYITSGGDPQKVNNAKNAIVYAAIGLVIIVAAQFIITFVLSKL